MYIFTIYGLVVDPHNDKLPVGLIAQLVAHCTGIAEIVSVYREMSLIFYQLKIG